MSFRLIQIHFLGDTWTFFSSDVWYCSSSSRHVFPLASFETIQKDPIYLPQNFLIALRLIGKFLVDYETLSSISNSNGLVHEFSAFLVFAVSIDKRISFVACFLLFKTNVVSADWTLFSGTKISVDGDGFSPHRRKKGKNLVASVMWLL